jgi:hypothetical protein
MAQFYDSLDERELARVAHILKRGGIEYTLVTAGSGSAMREILVAPEDLVYADALLSASGGSAH